ncbi:MAG: CBS domain-containing protein [Janthinobacterium lividum]
MTIAAILNVKGRAIVRIDPMAHVSEVVALLGEHRIGAVLVVDAAAERSNTQMQDILGIVSERDIIRAIGTSSFAGDVLDMTVSQIMTEARYTIALSASLADAAVLMTQRRVRHLPVIENDTLVGMISIGDVVKARLEQQASEMDSMTAYVSGAH